MGATNDGSDSTYPGISVSQTGGTADAVVVSHNHGITDPGHEHTFDSHDSDGGTGNTLNDNSDNSNQRTMTSSTETTGITINNEGVSGTNQNLPPFLALAFIQRTS